MNWNDFFAEEAKMPYYLSLARFLEKEYLEQTIYPAQEDIFKAFRITPLENVKVVIIGQDPYHEPGQAMGLSFSVPEGFLLPPSLQNIFKEIGDDLGIKMHNNGDLTYLARQGVLLLNALLTVRKGQPLSHNIPEYLTFLENVLKYLDKCGNPMVFLLWGNFARKLKTHITNPNHLVLEACHPSPLSANRGGFFGCCHFSKANIYLLDKGLDPIVWKN